MDLCARRPLTLILRAPVLVAGLSLIALVWLLGRRVFDRPVGLTAAAVLALSPSAALYSAEARAYGLMALCLTASTLVLLEATRREGLRWWAAYGLLTTPAMWFHYTAVFGVAVQLAWALWACPRQRLVAITSQTACAITFLPWLWHIRGDKAESAIAFFSPLNAQTLQSQPKIALMAGEYPTTTAKIVLVAIAAAVLRRLIVKLRPPRARLRPEVMLVVALALATPVGALVYSVLSADIWLSRNLFASLPAVSVVIGAVLTRPPRWVAASSTAVLLAALLVTVIHAARPAAQRPDYKAVASFLDAHAPPAAPILEASAGLGTALNSPIRSALTSNFRMRHLVVEADLAGSAAWRAGDPNCPVFAVELVSFLTGAIPPPPADVRLVARRRFVGVLPIDVLTYKRLTRSARCP